MADQPSLRELDSVADRIRQHRQVYERPVLIVEGPEDRLVLGPHLEGVDIFPADGRTNALDAASRLHAWSIEDFVAVYDRDFLPLADSIEMQAHPYDGRDLEHMLVGLGVLALVIDHQGSAAKLAQAGGSSALVERLIQIVEPVTKLRSANARHNLGLRFDDVDLASKIDLRTLTLKVISLHSALLAASDVVLAPSELLAEVGAVPDGLEPRGKDVVSAAGVALRRVAGSLPSAVADVAVLTAQLHSSAGLALERSSWMARLRAKLGIAVAESQSDGHSKT